MTSISTRLTNLERVAKAQRLEPDDTIDTATRLCAQLLLQLRPGVEHVQVRDCEDDATWLRINLLRAQAAGLGDEAREIRQRAEPYETIPADKMLTPEWYPRWRAESERQDAAIDRAIAVAARRVEGS